MKKRYVTTRDIVIPAGTVVKVNGAGTTSRFYDHASVLISETKDIVSEWSMELDQALEIGLVQEETGDGRTTENPGRDSSPGPGS